MAFESGKLVRVALRASNPDKGQEMVNTVHYDSEEDDPLLHNDMQLLADRIRDDVLVPFRALFNAAWTIDPVVVTEEVDPQNPSASREQWSSGASAPGTRAASGDLMPTAICQLYYWNTGLVGRSFRGRCFVGGTTTEGDQVDGIFGATGFSVLAEAFVNAFPLQPDVATGASSDTCSLCVYSRTRRAADQDPYAPHVIGHSRSMQVRWLRSRQPGN